MVLKDCCATSYFLGLIFNNEHQERRSATVVTSWYQKAREFKSPTHVVAAFLLRSRETQVATNRRLHEEITEGETKPDLVEIGGNLVKDGQLNVSSNSATNIAMASHQLSPAVARNYGTSFATPRVAHQLAVVLQELKELGLTEISAPFLKAFLVNSARCRFSKFWVETVSGAAFLDHHSSTKPC